MTDKQLNAEIIAALDELFEVKVGGAFAVLSERVADLERRMSDRLNESDGHSKWLNTLESRVADNKRAFEDRGDAYDKRMKRIELLSLDRFNTLASRITGVDDDLGAAIDDLAALTHTVNEDREALPDPLEIEALQTSAEASETELFEVKVMIDSISQELDAIRAALTYAVRSIVAVMGEPVDADSYEELGQKLAGKVVVPGLNSEPISVGDVPADENGYYGDPNDLSDDADALASAGMGTDEDYGGLPSDIEPRDPGDN